MSQITKSQVAVFDLLKKGICESVQKTPVSKGAIEITTPFVDFKGYPLSIYVTQDGKITDGGATINELIALRVYEDFEGWVFQEDYFDQHQIQNVKGRLEPINPESAEALIDYLQGIARLPGFFEARPIRSQEQIYPTHVKEIVKSGLMEIKQLSEKEAEKFIMPRPLKLRGGYQIQSELSPNRQTTIVKIISHAKSPVTEQKEHVSHKILEPVLFKEDNKHATSCIILDRLNDYNLTSRKLIKERADILIETVHPNSTQQIVETLAEA